MPLEGHANFVISVCVTRPDDNYPEGLIYTGSNDRTILAYIPDVPDPIFKVGTDDDGKDDYDDGDDDGEKCPFSDVFCLSVILRPHTRV